MVREQATPSHSIDDDILPSPEGFAVPADAWPELTLADFKARRQAAIERLDRVLAATLPPDTYLINFWCAGQNICHYRLRLGDEEVDLIDKVACATPPDKVKAMAREVIAARLGAEAAQHAEFVVTWTGEAV